MFTLTSKHAVWSTQTLKQHLWSRAETTNTSVPPINKERKLWFRSAECLTCSRRKSRSMTEALRSAVFCSLIARDPGTGGEQRPESGQHFWWVWCVCVCVFGKKGSWGSWRGGTQKVRLHTDKHPPLVCFGSGRRDHHGYTVYHSNEVSPEGQRRAE